MSNQRGLTRIIEENKELVSIDELLKQNQDKIKSVLKKDGNRFIASVIKLSQDLKGVDPISIFNSVTVAMLLKLELDKSLGLAYVVPRSNNGKKEAQFQIGYKGLMQLALRSGKIKTFTVNEIYEGMLLHFNPITEKYELSDEYEEEEIVGYMVYAETVDGFEKTMYLKKSKIMAHAKKYSDSYKKDLREGTKKSVWFTDNDAMCKKTMVKKISKFLPMSIEFQTALKYDQSVIRKIELDNEQNIICDEVDYVDNKQKEIETKEEFIKKVSEEENIQETISALFK